MDERLELYLSYFKKLKRGFNPGFGKAPHKPILLLSILKLIDSGVIVNNRIYISSELVITFKDLFKRLVITGHHDNFALPFFHMQNEPFYRLMPKTAMIGALNKQKSVNSLNKLNDLVAFSEIDKELFEFLLDDSLRIIITEYLLHEYFEDTKELGSEKYNFLELAIENDILNEPPEAYQTKFKGLETSLDKISFEEEVFIRSGVFKKTVPKIYNYSCCISQFTVKSTYNIQMVDACHIIPFSINQNDNIQNGLSLSPNMHRAFDRGFLTINDRYQVRISPAINKIESSKKLLSYEGQIIQLPENEKYYPSLEALEWHRKEVFLF
jgi:putative restriction endonuclease